MLFKNFISTAKINFLITVFKKNLVPKNLSSLVLSTSKKIILKPIDLGPL